MVPNVEKHLPGDSDEVQKVSGPQLPVLKRRSMEKLGFRTAPLKTGGFEGLTQSVGVRLTSHFQGNSPRGPL